MDESYSYKSGPGNAGITECVCCVSMCMDIRVCVYMSTVGRLFSLAWLRNLLEHSELQIVESKCNYPVLDLLGENI